MNSARCILSCTIGGVDVKVRAVPWNQLSWNLYIDARYSFQGGVYVPTARATIARAIRMAVHA